MHEYLSDKVSFSTLIVSGSAIGLSFIPYIIESSTSISTSLVLNARVNLSSFSLTYDMSFSRTISESSLLLLMKLLDWDDSAR